MNQKPIVIYVDDEPQNLIVFEAALPTDWEIVTFDSPLKALDQITKLEPWVVVSDQRMPGMSGVSFLEIVKRTHPYAKRVLITGYSEEDLIVDSIRKAGVHDYIRKPWDVDDLLHRIEGVVETYKLERDLRNKKELIEKQVKELSTLAANLEKAKCEEEILRKELEAWAPPFILSAIKDPSTNFPMVRNLALITYDIIGSSKLHGLHVDGHLVRSLILKEFSELVIKHGGLRESHSGDSAYAHFGLVPGFAKPEESALAVATEFRTFLRSFALKFNVEVECGISLHFENNITIQLHTAEILTPKGKVVQRSFDTSSPGVDLVHRIEKLVHELPGTNIIMTEDFVKSLSISIYNLIELGLVHLKGQPNPTRLFIKPGDVVGPEVLQSFIAGVFLAEDPADRKERAA